MSGTGGRVSWEARSRIRDRRPVPTVQGRDRASGIVSFRAPVAGAGGTGHAEADSHQGVQVSVRSGGAAFAPHLAVRPERGRQEQFPRCPPTPDYPPHYPHLVAARRELERWLFFYFEPRERMRAANPIKEVRHIGLMGEELAAFLNTLRALGPRQFEVVEKALRTMMPNVDGIETDVSDLGEVDLHLRESGVAIPARVLSEGTLRLLGLLALTGADEAPSLVGFEEPENGVHPRRIRMIAELLKTRSGLGPTQYIVTTHSPILPDLLPDDSLFAVRRIDRRTWIDPSSVWQPLGPMGRRGDVDRALDAKAGDGEANLPVSERILRGDFDA